MKIRTHDLTGPALDWAVAKCEGVNFELPESFQDYHDCGRFNYSKSWEQGGPIIEGERINLLNWTCDWDASMTSGPRASRRVNGDTPLIAAMRCYVASNLGDEVEIPEELLT